MSEGPLFIRGKYVYNISSDWYSCTIISGSKRFQIKVIPPKSARSFPEEFSYPSLSFQVKCRPDDIAAYSINYQADNSPLEQINIHVSGNWPGIYEFNGTKQSIQSTIEIDGPKMRGWFLFQEKIAFLSGRLNQKTHFINVDIFYDNSSHPASGRLDFYEGKYSLSFQSSNENFLATSEILSSISEEENPDITGKYMGFSIQEEQQIEYTLKLTCFINGFISGQIFDRSDKEIFGAYDSKAHKFFLVRLRSGSDYVYYIADTTNNDGSISGTWAENMHTRGTFAFIKRVSDDK